MLLKARLMTPGPTAMAESTRLALAEAMPHHRSPAFIAEMGRVQEGLRWLWEAGEDDDVVVVAGSGTTGMEAAMSTVLAPGSRVLVAHAGKFGARWCELAGMLGCDVVEVSRPWGRSVLPEHVEEALSSVGAVDAFVCVASETSTGALQPVPELAQAVRVHAPEALVIVDGITAVGCVDLSMTRHGIDVLVSGSQKAFGLPPGAAFVGLSARAWRASERVPCRSMVLDLRRERKQRETGQTAFTPAIAVLWGLREVLGRWQAMGREALLGHAEALAGACRAGVEAIGLPRFAVDLPSPALTSASVEAPLDGGLLVRRLRDHYGTQVAGGQDALKGRLVRVGHLGAVDPFDVLQALAALEFALAEQGHRVVFGSGVGAAQKRLAPWMAVAPPTFVRP